MKQSTNYLPASKAKNTLPLQHTQKSMFSKAQLQAVKIKKEKPPPPPILLKTIVPFGQYKGMAIQQLLNKPGYIHWFATATKKQLSTEVLTAIQNNNFLAQ